MAVHTLPEAEKLADGTPFNKVCPLKADEKLAAAFALPQKRSALPEETYVLTVTCGGLVKKSLIGELPGPSAQTFYLCKVNDGDALGWAALTDGKKEILLATATGMAIRFNEEEVRPMGLAAAGVNGVKLGVGDEVVGAEVLGAAEASAEVFIVCSDGKAKRVPVKEFPAQGRYGKGVIAWELPKNIKLAGMAVGKGTHVVTLHLLKAAPKMTRLDEAGLKKRATVRGDVVVEAKPGDGVLSVTDGWMVEKFLAVKSDEKKETSKKSEVKGGKVEQMELLAPSVKEKRAPAVGKAVDKKPITSKKTPAKPAAKGKMGDTAATSSPPGKKPALTKPTPKNTRK